MEVEGFTKRPLRQKARPSELVNYLSEKIIKKGSRYPHFYFEFNSINDLLKCVKHNSLEHGNKSWDNGGVDHNQDSAWVYGKEYKNYKNTIEHLQRGSVVQSTLDQYDKLKNEIEEHFPELHELQRMAFKTRKRRKFSEEGGELDIDRYMSGDPEMWQTTQVIKDKKTMKILFNCGIGGVNAAEVIIENVILLALFMDIVSALGISVELWFSCVTQDSTDISDYTVVSALIKSADEQVDIQSVLAVSVPGLFRYFIFRILGNIVPGQANEYVGSVVHHTPQWIFEMYEYDLCIFGGSEKTDLVKTLVEKCKQLIETL